MVAFASLPSTECNNCLGCNMSIVKVHIIIVGLHLQILSFQISVKTLALQMLSISEY